MHYPIMKFCKYRFFIAAVLLLAGCSQLSSNEIISQYSSNNSQSTREIIKQINYTINHRIEYQLDQRQYGLLDYWAAPIEALKNGKGDCEDYAFLKRELLIRIGIPKESLKLMQADVDSFAKVAHKKQITMPHIVLAYYPNEHTTNPLILDNSTDAIKYLRSLKGFHLNYIFNEQAVWKVSGNNQQTLVNNTDILPKFSALVARQRGNSNKAM